MEKTARYKQNQKEFQLILSRFTHEIRNPLTLISSSLQMLESEHPAVSDWRGWDDITDNLKYIQNLLDDFSGYQNAGKLSPAPVDTSVFFRRIAGSFRPALQYLGIRLETRIPEDLPPILADQTKLRQAFLNLIRNAQESIQHDHGRICLAVSAASGGIQIELTDNGCGMTQKQLDTVFRPFVTYKPDGTGLGLAITREIIDAHRGNLKVISTPGEGTCFCIFLPDGTKIPPGQSLR